MILFAAATDNNIGAAGASAIAKALSVNTTIKTLCLSCSDSQASTGFGDAGAEAIAQSLKANTSLREIFLGGSCS